MRSLRLCVVVSEKSNPGMRGLMPSIPSTIASLKKNISADANMQVAALMKPFHLGKRISAKSDHMNMNGGSENAVATRKNEGEPWRMPMAVIMMMNRSV